MNAASYGISTAMSGQSWDWGQFAGQVGKGAALGGLTAGAGLGFSAGLNAMGMGVQASNFIGGALGSFSGSFFGGGLPQSPMEWASAGMGAIMAGSAMQVANPLGLSAGQPPLVDIGRPLPEVVVHAKRLRTPWWWGMTQQLLDGEMVMKGGQLFLANNLPLSTGAVNPTYAIESMVLGGIATRGAVNALSFAAKTGGQLSTRFVSTSKGLTDLKPTLNRIASGGKFPHRNDGSIFRNFEGLLPKQNAGFYREFVHPTPGIKGPGAMRIVTGQNGRMWFTPDHYKTFVPIR